MAIIFITAYSDNETVQEASRALPHGYLVKPFTERDISIALTIAEEHLKRPDPHQDTGAKTSIRIDDQYTYECQFATLFKNGQAIDLTANESALIALLCKHTASIVSYDQIIHEIWDGREVSKTTVRDTVYRIRKKAQDLPIETVASVGYRIGR